MTPEQTLGNVLQKLIFYTRTCRHWQNWIDSVCPMGEWDYPQVTNQHHPPCHCLENCLTDDKTWQMKPSLYIGLTFSHLTLSYHKKKIYIDKDGMQNCEALNIEFFKLVSFLELYIVIHSLSSIKLQR